MVIQFTLQNLMLFLVSALGILVGVLLLSILWNIKKIVAIFLPMVEINQESITKAIQTMPGMFENMGQVSCNVRETTDKLKISIPMIITEVESITNAAKGSLKLVEVVMENMDAEINETIAAHNKDTSGFMAYLHIFEEVSQIIYRSFASRK